LGKRVKEDAKFRAEMAYCGPRGIPHSVFRSWLPDDQDKALGWLAYGHSTCPECHTFPEDYLDQDGREIYPPPFLVQTERCGGCLLIKAKIREIGEKNLTGLSMRLVPNPRFKGL
jgi:hypothetical protein